MVLRAALAAARAQVVMTRRNVEDLYPVLTIPLTSFISLAVLQHSGREDLAGYALTAAVLMSVGQMAFFVGSEILANERQGQSLELVVASPTPYPLLLITRVTLLSTIGLIGLVESWLLARLVFGIRVTIHHPAVLLMTLLLTVLAGSVTSLATATLFCFGKTTRTYQNALSGPLYLLSGVLVPVSFLPEFIQPLSRVLYLFWSADLLRESLRPEPIEHFAGRLGAIGALGILGGIIGTILVNRLLAHLRREGTLGL